MQSFILGIIVISILLIIGLFVFKQTGDNWQPRQVRSDTAHDYIYEWPYHQRIPNEGYFLKAHREYKPWVDQLSRLKNPIYQLVY